MAYGKLCLIAALATLCLHGVDGHGMMMDPINRSSAWRKGFDVPPNFTDNEHFCGGFQAHFITNNGKCGECGDDYSLPRPRPNENGGIYGTGTIVQQYAKGAVVNVTVRLTANHWGTFKFSLCPLASSNDLETEECFKEHPLQLADGSGDTWTLNSDEKRDYYIPVVLPSDVTCEHCVFRWHYRTANSWGRCEDGSEAMGCGDQETFRSCADVSIQ